MGLQCNEKQTIKACRLSYLLYWCCIRFLCGNSESRPALDDSDPFGVVLPVNYGTQAYVAPLFTWKSGVCFGNIEGEGFQK